MADHIDPNGDEAVYRANENFACDVCGNRPDAEGWLEHGRGCYTQDEDGGGSEYIAAADHTHEDGPCACTPQCKRPCKGECGCRQCHGGYMDYLSGIDDG